MPPKKRARAATAAGSAAAAAGGETDHGTSAALDAALLEIDILYDGMKSELDALIQAPLDEIKAIVSKHLLLMPSKIAAMNMRDFLREGGGTFAAVLDKRKAEARAARTALKPAPTASRVGAASGGGSGGGGSSVAAAAAAAYNAGAGAGTGAAAASSSVLASVLLQSAAKAPGAAASRAGLLAAHDDAPGGGGGGGGGGGLPQVTPAGAGAPRSRVADAAGAAAGAGGGGGGAAPAPAPRVPTLAAMRSAALPPGAALSAATPGGAFSGFLPKTPGPDASKLPRARRRNEVVYHISSNGSPLDGAGGGPVVPSVVVPLPAPGRPPTAVVAVGTGAVRLDDVAALDAVAAGSAEDQAAVLASLEAVMQQALAAQARIRGLAVAGAAAPGGGALGGGGGGGGARA